MTIYEQQIDFDDKPWLEDNDNPREMCNLKEVQDVFHLFGEFVLF